MQSAADGTYDRAHEDSGHLFGVIGANKLLQSSGVPYNKAPTCKKNVKKLKNREIVKKITAF